MDMIWLALAFAAGTSLGAIVCWLLISRTASQSKERADSGKQEVLLLTERVHNKDAELVRLQQIAKCSSEEVEALRSRLTQSLTELSAANERNLRLNDYQTLLQQKDLQVLECKDRVSALERSTAELSTLLQEERKSSAEKVALLAESKQKFEEVFKSLSDSALNRNTETFMNIAKNILDKYQEGARNDLEHRQKSIDLLVKPLSESLKEVDQKMNDMEKARTSAYELLTDQVSKLSETQNKLQQALRAPATRGRWGEIQLRRVVEMAGMVQHCDFVEQATVDDGDKRLRPDMVVLLPEDKSVVVDSKVPMQAYLDLLEAQDDITKRKLLEEHVRQLRNHILSLGQKSYWEQFAQSPEFVVMFLPNDAFFIAATEEDHSILEYAIEKKVLIATPMTLVALLQTVAYTWRQKSVAENAAEIKSLGKQLYDRVRSLAGHFEDIRKGLDSSVKSYNRAVSSFESRVLVTTRKFKELGAGDGAEIDVIEVSESSPVELRLKGLLTTAASSAFTPGPLESEVSIVS